MFKNGMYFGDAALYELIRKLGGQWNDAKERPIVCLLPAKENPNLYWAIPVGNWEHRDEKAKARIMSYLESDTRHIRSCFYHLGKTTTKSIFFISDVIPITDKYIAREYLGYNSQIYIIKNKHLIAELERKLKRILSYEAVNKNYFRQHITDIKNYLLQKINDSISSLNEKNSYNDFQDESFNNSSSILEESLFEKSKSDDIEPGDSLYKIT